MSTYQLTSITTNKSSVISEKEFSALRISMESLTQSFYLEEKYDFITQHKITLETELTN
jgi:hypothetical protein